MVVRTAGHQRDIALKKRCGHGARVFGHGVLIRAEFRLQGLAQRYGLRRDHMHQRAALTAGENGRINLAGDGLVVGKDQAAARAAQRLMGGSGGDIGKADGRRMLARGDQASDMRHIHHQIRAAFIGDFAEAPEIDCARIGRCARDDHARPMLHGQRAHLLIVDQTGFRIAAVGDNVVKLAGEIR